MKVKVRKFGEILTSRPAGRDASLTIKACFKPELSERIELDFNGVLAVSPGWLDEVLNLLRNEYGTERVICLPSKNASVKESLKIIEEQPGQQS